MILIIGFCYSGLLTFISLYAKEIHLERAASFYFLVYSIVVLVSRPFSGRLLDVKGANYVVYPCLLFYAAGMLLFSQATLGVTLLAAGIFLGLGYGNFISSAQAISIQGVPPPPAGAGDNNVFHFCGSGILASDLICWASWSPSRGIAACM